MKPSTLATIHIVSQTLGWLYFISWSISFYPQAVLNEQLHSVTGLSIDFVVANFFGFLFYSIFVSTMYWSPEIRKDYRSRHQGNDNLVEVNDVTFALHALVLTAIYLIQVVRFRKAGEGMSRIGYAIAAFLSIGVMSALVYTALGLWTWLDFLYLLSYVKLFLTITKYIPQAYMNYVRKSTAGWNIWNVLLDSAGGVFSISQLLLDCHVSGHWSGVMGFLIKAALGIVSLVFDGFFLIQHYILYPERPGSTKIVIENNRQEYGGSITKERNPSPRSSNK